MELYITVISVIFLSIATLLALLLTVSSRRLVFVPLTLVILLMCIRQCYSFSQHLFYGRPSDPVIEAIGLVISSLMVLGLISLRLNHKQQPFSNKGIQLALSSSVQINLARIALFLGAITAVVCCVIGYIASGASRKVILESIFVQNMAIARNVASELRNQSDPEDEDELTKLVTNAWLKVDKKTDLSHICVTTNQGRLLLNSLYPDNVGYDVSEIPFFPHGNSSQAFISELLKSKEDCTGYFLGESDLKYAFSSTYLPNLDLTIAVHAPTSVVEAKIRNDIFPWASGLAITTFMLLPAALGLLYWSYSSSLSQRQEAELSLLESEHRYRTLAEVSPVGIFHSDTEGNCLYVNQRWSNISGISFQEALGDGWSKGLHLEDRQRVFHEWKKATSEGLSFQGEYRFQLPDGKITWVICQAESTVDTQGKMSGYVGTITDITERKRIIQERVTAQEKLIEYKERENETVQSKLKKVQQELIQSTRLATIGQMSAQIAHDIRNPLGAVSNAVFYLRRKVPLEEPKWKEYLDLIQSEVDVCGKIINNLLSLTKDHSPEYAEVELKNFIEEAIERLNISKDIEVRLNCPETPLCVHIDPVQFRQVLDNLIINSVDALDGEGEILISVRKTEDFDEITIQDTGSGVPREVRDSIFEPFVTSKSKGTGLGLAICRQIMDQHEGSIELVEGGEYNTAFRIQLPRESSLLSVEGNI